MLEFSLGAMITTYLIGVIAFFIIIAALNTKEKEDRNCIPAWCAIFSWIGVATTILFLFLLFLKWAYGKRNILNHKPKFKRRRK